MGPEQEPKDSGEWQDWRDYTSRPEGSSLFTYNPNPPEGKGGPFEEVDDVDAPEKM